MVAVASRAGPLITPVGRLEAPDGRDSPVIGNRATLKSSKFLALCLNLFPGILSLTIGLEVIGGLGLRTGLWGSRKPHKLVAP